MTARGSGRARGAGCALLAGWLAACAAAPPAAPPPGYQANRRDYRAFAAAWPGLYEPNYLPFMLHRWPGGAAGDVLFFCRWDASSMPLRVFVPPVEIPDEIQDEFWPRDPGVYERAALTALDVWQRELEGYVRFERVFEPEAADLTLRLVGARAPVPDEDHTVLGLTHLADACSVTGLDPDAERFEVRFAVPALEIYLADEHGLLAVDQVHQIALHEIGHVLGMRGHSPIPADLMYEVARDRLQVGGALSLQDVNSFVSLYRLPNGAIYGRVPVEPLEPGLRGPGPPQLAMAPYVDARHGFSLRLPDGWTHFDSQHGVVAVDGATWDYDASLQVAVQRYATLEAFLDRFGAYYLMSGDATRPASLRVDGRRALSAEIVLHDAPRIERVTLVEVGDGRVLVITADCPADRIAEYGPWFDAVLDSLRIRDLPEDAWPRRP